MQRVRSYPVPSRRRAVVQMAVVRKPYTTDVAIDPVCGMTVGERTAAGSHDYNGVTYYFCGRGCLERFKSDPETYLARKPSERSMPAPARVELHSISKPAATHAAAPAVEYTCPMHPEIVRPGPGPCPICGMALEPRVATLSDAPNPELVDMV